MRSVQPRCRTDASSAASDVYKCQDLGHKSRAVNAVIIPPKSQKIHPLQGIVHKQTFSVTGWALGGEVLKKHHADHVIPLSDHADFDELLEIVERVNPSTVYCTHGPKTFVDHLKEQGHDARWLE